MIDLGKLSPAPWRAECPRINWRIMSGINFVMEGAQVRKQTDAEFIALARNAFDVLFHRGWSISGSPWENKFWVHAEDVGGGGYDRNDWHPSEFQKWIVGRCWPDPFTALVEADAWYIANVETKPPATEPASTERADP